MSSTSQRPFSFLKLLMLVILFTASQQKVDAQTAASYTFNAFVDTFVHDTGTYFTAIMTDDSTQTGIPIGFSFNFAGTNYDSLSVCSNGFMAFMSNAQDSANSQANASNIGPMLMPLWDNLSGGGPVSAAFYKTIGLAPRNVSLNGSQQGSILQLF